MVVTAAILEILLNGRMDSDPTEFAAELGVELTREQEIYLKDTVLRTIDQLAIPFLDSLPEELQSRYRAKLHDSTAGSSEETEVYSI